MLDLKVLPKTPGSDAILSMRIHQSALKSFYQQPKHTGRFRRNTAFWGLLAMQIAGSAVLCGQVSPSAYRALGQPDLRRNGVNGVQGTELYSPLAIALDAR